ncbi:hypothetical protein [Variovorax boronicumulans]|uniref:hypothetical protein n=1 Tax=Variovorax boronicumulans TaxID=436515 RepID=UPI001C56F070
MTRAEALLKLLALGDLRLPELFDICGWPFDELKSELESLVASRQVSWINAAGFRFYRCRAIDARAVLQTHTQGTTCS